MTQAPAEADDGNGPSPRRRGIQSVEIGFKILTRMSDLGAPSSLSAIAQACDMPPPQVHRYLQSLIASDMALQEAHTGRYDLGPAALRLGLSALARTDAFCLLDNLIGDYVLRRGETIQVAALGPLGSTIVRWYMGRPGIATSLTVGSVTSLLHSATGRVFLTFAPTVLTQALLAAELQRTPMQSHDLQALREAILAQGFAHAAGTVTPGLDATAFPIFNLQGIPVLVATILVAQGIERPDRAEAVAELGTICRQISQQLGWLEPVA